MKKKNSMVLLVLAAFVFVFAISGCNDTDKLSNVGPVGVTDPEGLAYPFLQEAFVVSFDSGGGNYVDAINGNSPNADPQYVWARARASVPGLVAKEGAYFTGWYDAQTNGREWDFAEYLVEKDMTLYAQWAPSGHTVDFNLNLPESGMDAKTVLTYTPLRENIASGAMAAEPLQFGIQPDNDYANIYIFSGWYDAPTGGRKWDFDNMGVTRDITLHAQWVGIAHPDNLVGAPATPIQPATVFTVKFDSKANKNPPANQYVVSGSRILPPYVAYRDGYSFGGWYKDAGYTDDWLFHVDAADTTNDSLYGAKDNAITLYAKWAPLNPVDVTKDMDIVDFRYILFAGGQTAYNGDAAQGNSTNLSENARVNNDGEIARIAEELTRYPHYRVMIVGHANPAAISDQEDPQNAELMAISEGRAKSIQQKLEEELRRRGSSYDYLGQTPIVVQWEGGKKAASNPMLSRRVEIIVFDFIQEIIL